MTRFARLVTRHALAVLLLVAVATLAGLHGIVDLRSGRLRLEVDPSVDRLLPEGDEERRFYDRARELFGSDEVVLLVLSADDLFRPDHLARIQRITRRVAQLPGVHRVLSLANATDVRGEQGEIVVAPIYDSVPQDPAALARLRERVQSHPIYGGNLVSKDGGATAILVYFDRISDRKLIEERLSARIAAIGQEERGDAQVFVTGSPHVKLLLSETLLGELSYIVPLIFALAALLSLAAFRTLRGVVLPFASITISVVWTLGAMGWTGSPLNLVSNIVPPLVITLGFAAAMHVVSEYYEKLRHEAHAGREAHRSAVEHALAEMGLAVAVNGFTTALGFASLLVTTVVAIREFGTWAVVGVVATTVVSITLIPAALVLVGPPKRLAIAAEGDRFDRIADGLAGFAVSRRWTIILFSFLVFGIALAGMTRIRVATEYITSFARDAPVRVDYEAINERLGGASSLFIVIAGDRDAAFAEPENLRALRELQDWLEDQPEIGVTNSIADNVMLLNRAFHDNDPATYSVPDSARTIKQLLLFGGDAVTTGFVDASLETANVVVRSTVSDSAPVAKLLARIDARLQELPRALSGRVTGDVVLLNRTVDRIAVNELQSIFAALLTIYLTMAAMLTSFRVGLIALLPNLLPIAIYYGVLGLLDIPLDLSTSLIGSIALGIAVDDTVHYFSRFNLDARRLGDERLATSATLRSVIRPTFFTTVGLCLGFLALTLSDLRSQATFGVLAAFTLAVALIFEFTLSPALASGLRLVTLWDLLTLDLGPQPQGTIPLFEGLSLRQARIFALMSEIVTAPAGKRLLGEGDKGGHMYVVIEGELVASVRGERGRVELARMGRGDSVGEVALFSEGRMADVDVASDARLLRFDDEDLTRLGRRYPRTAMKVYRNLNRILAQRVVGTHRALR